MFTDTPFASVDKPVPARTRRVLTRIKAFFLVRPLSAVIIPIHRGHYLS